nr:replication protein A 70 kDa DNA-binding subunit A-like [Ipomoea batatas]GMC75067.1 replication protein A 70 kDa DNA-binding subunit A-like [Ipomoea batatas]
MNSSLSQANSLDTFSSGSMVINTISEVYALRQLGIGYWVVAKIVELEVMKIINNRALVDAHCPQLLEIADNEDVEEPLNLEDSDECSLLDEFSSTQTSKKTKDFCSYQNGEIGLGYILRVEPVLK